MGCKLQIYIIEGEIMNTEIIEEKHNKKIKSNILEKTQSIINYSKHEINNFKNGKVKIAKNERDV